MLLHAAENLHIYYIYIHYTLCVHEVCAIYLFFSFNGLGSALPLCMCVHANLYHYVVRLPGPRQMVDNFSVFDSLLSFIVIHRRVTYKKQHKKYIYNVYWNT